MLECSTADADGRVSCRSVSYSCSLTAVRCVALLRCLVVLLRFVVARSAGDVGKFDRREAYSRGLH